MHKKFTRLVSLTILLSTSLFGQIAFQAAPNPHPVFFGTNGLALAGGQVCTYQSGTTTPLATYKDNLGTANSTCITLDAGGSAFIYLGQSAYRFITFNSLGVQQYLYDPVSNFTQFLLSTQNAWTQPQQFTGATSDPTGSAGLLWYRTDLLRLRYFDSSWHSLIGADTTDTLTNKTLTSPTVTAGTFTSPSISNPATSGTDSGSEILNNKTLTGTAMANSVTKLLSSDNAGAITGTGALANFFSTTLNANSMTASKGIRITIGATHTGTAAVAYQFNFGACTISMGTGPTAANSSTWILTIRNKGGVTNAQVVTEIGNMGTVTAAAAQTCAIDTTVNQTISAQFNVANTDSVTPIEFLIEQIQ